MKSILIIDDQKWVKDLCREAYDPNMYCLKATEDVEKAMTDIKEYNPDLALLNLYTKCRITGWDLLLDIKMQNPLLPVILIAGHEKFLFDQRLTQADGYVIVDSFACKDLKQKTTWIFNRKAAA
jgi:DNA-binding NtrC family response regulator